MRKPTGGRRAFRKTSGVPFSAADLISSALASGFLAHALRVRLGPFPCSARPQPEGTEMALDTQLGIKVAQGVEDTRKSLRISPRIAEADQSSITCPLGASRHLIKARLAGGRLVLRSIDCHGTSSDAFQHSNCSRPAFPCIALMRDYGRFAVEIRARSRQACDVLAVALRRLDSFIWSF